jgi:hypothetical protein
VDGRNKSGHDASTIVTTGLDPVVHAEVSNTRRCRMDCRVKPGNDTCQIPGMITIHIDTDACPVKQEIYRVAERHARKGTALGAPRQARYLSSIASTARIVGR